MCSAIKWIKGIKSDSLICVRYLRKIPVWSLVIDLMYLLAFLRCEGPKHFFVCQILTLMKSFLPFSNRFYLLYIDY